jgi:uncharacterized protein
MVNSCFQETVSLVGNLLQGFTKVAVAVSGGIDSLTLAIIAGRKHYNSDMFHTVSPAVPAEATARVKDFAVREGWRLQIINAGEFAREEYITNPVNRCFYCKDSLYSAIAIVAANTDAQIISGTNADDLLEYRPGLDAARNYGVRHPYAELNIDKKTIREVARYLGVNDIADLPSSPCLASRVETGIGITAELLSLINASETMIRANIDTTDVRCRVRRSGIVIEIDSASLTRLTNNQQLHILEMVNRIFGGTGANTSVKIAPYRVGSAFLVNRNA